MGLLRIGGELVEASEAQAHKSGNTSSLDLFCSTSKSRC